MDRASADHIAQLIKEEFTKRFPDVALQQVELLQYGDEPVIEPGELLLRFTLASDPSEAAREQALRSFEHAHHEALEQFRDDLAIRLPEARRVEFSATGGDRKGPRIMLARPGRSIEARVMPGGDLTPVMARLGPADLETLDTLITAGIAPNRAEAVRWALAKIRERPAYGQLRDRAREIEELKAKF
jgi:hypothetical protein